MSRHGRLHTTAVVTAVALLLGAGTAQAHGPAGAGMSEHELEVVETATLGRAHAKEHAEQRRILAQPATQKKLRRDRRAAARAYLADLVTSDPARDGAWAPPVDLPRPAINAALLPTGKVLMYARPPAAPGITIWDPATNRTRTITPKMGADPDNIFCSGFTFLPDGRLVVVGGQLGPNPTDTTVQDYKGLNRVYTFNPFNETWTRQPDMGHGRWYPTTSMTADGRVLILDGLDETGVPGRHNTDIDVFTPSAALNGVGTVTRVSGRGGAGEPPTGEYYPHMWLMPSGRTLVAGPNPVDSWFVNPLGAGSQFSWQQASNTMAYHLWGSGVLMPSDSPGSSQVMLIGGRTDPRGYNESYDERTDRWTAQAPLSVDREHHNTVLLPDGSMVTIGGGVGIDSSGDKYAFTPDQTKVDLWDPASRTWRFGAAQLEGRTYHSTALLLPDGRVMSAGDDGNARTGQDPRLVDDAEVYSPPYLFNADGSRATRPRITAKPARITWGGKAVLRYDTTDVKKAVLLAPGADTHANDMNMRYVPLPVVANTGSKLTVQAPPNAAQAPPGYYMLFLVNGRGVPSVANWVRVGAAGPVAAPTTGSGGGGTVPAGAGGAPAGTGQGATRQAAASASAPAPLVEVRRLHTPRLRALVRHGLRVEVTCERRCTIAARLWWVARRQRTAVAGQGALLREAGSKRLTLRPDRRADQRLLRLRRLKLRLRITATDAAGARQTVRRSLIVRR